MLKNKIAIVNQWPGTPNAEKENLQRICDSAHALKIQTIIIDKLGYCLDTGKQITGNDVDFVINLHFETPKSYDAYSYVALWNPLAFYFEWGYRKFSEHLATHNDFLSCSSAWADDHLKRLISNDSSRLAPVFSLHHTLSENIQSPRLLTNPKIFYCGINWERVNNSKGRFEPILKVLDEQNIVTIYGPEELNGVAVWEGFANYAGSIPFNGKSSVNEIANCGVALVFSSDAHKQSGLMSNRLFESAAAGAVIIADDNPFVRKHFADSVLYVDFCNDPTVVTQQIINHYEWIKNNPIIALELAKQAQDIFISQFNLKNELKTLIDNHQARKKALHKLFMAQTHDKSIALIHIFHQPSQADIDALLDSLKRQSYQNFNLTIYINENATSSPPDIKLKRTPFPAFLKSVPLTNKRGQFLISAGQILQKHLEENVKDELIHLSLTKTIMMEEHLSALVRQFENESVKTIAFSDILIQHFDEHNKEHRDFFGLRRIEDILSHCQKFQIPFMVNATAIKELPACFLNYLDKLLPAFISLELSNHEKNVIGYTLRPTCIIDLKHINDQLLTVDRQKAIIEDKYTHAFSIPTLQSQPHHPPLEPQPVDILKLVQEHGLQKKYQLAEEILRYIPLKKSVRSLLVKAYRTIKSKEPALESDP